MRQGARVREPAIRAIEGADRPGLPHESHGFPHGSRGLLRRVPAEEGQWRVTSGGEKGKRDPHPPFRQLLRRFPPTNPPKTKNKSPPPVSQRRATPVGVERRKHQDQGERPR